MEFNSRKKLEKSQLSTASKNTIKTLLLGKKDALDRKLVQAYADAGVIHIFAISGLHIGIVMLFLGFMLKPVKWIHGGKWIYHLHHRTVVEFCALYARQPLCNKSGMNV